MDIQVGNWSRRLRIVAVVAIVATGSALASADSGLIEIRDDQPYDGADQEYDSAGPSKPSRKPASLPLRYARQSTANQLASCESCGSSSCNGSCVSGGASGCDLGSCNWGDACDNGCALGGCDGGCYDPCAGGCDPCCDPCLPCAPWWAHRSSAFGEALYLHVTNADVHHAQQQNGIGGAGTVPFGLIGHLDPDWEPGFRVGMSKAFTNCSSIEGSYTFYESRAVSTIIPPVIPNQGGAVGSLVQHPGAAITASAGPVNATYDVDFQLADFDYRAVWKASSRYAINWSLGGRYGHLEQSFGQSGVFGGGNGGVINTLSHVDFDGGGIRFGLDGERRVGSLGLSIYAKGVIAPMTGTIQADYTELNQTTDVLLARSVFKDDRVIASLDYEAGLAWTSAQRKWRASAGYMASYWFNVATVSEYISAVQANGYDDASGTVTFEGLTARIERRW